MFPNATTQPYSQSPRQPGVEQPQSPGPMAPPPDDSGADFSDLDPMMLKRLADLYGIPFEEAAQLIRLKRADMMAQSEMPQGRQVGDVFVASSPLEMGAAALQKGMGMRQMNQLAGERSALGQRGVRDYEAAYGLYGGKGLGF